MSKEPLYGSISPSWVGDPSPTHNRHRRLPSTSVHSSAIQEGSAIESTKSVNARSCSHIRWSVLRARRISKNREEEERSACASSKDHHKGGDRVGISCRTLHTAGPAIERGERDRSQKHMSRRRRLMGLIPIPRLRRMAVDGSGITKLRIEILNCGKGGWQNCGRHRPSISAAREKAKKAVAATGS